MREETHAYLCAQPGHWFGLILGKWMGLENTNIIAIIRQTKY